MNHRNIKIWKCLLFRQFPFPKVIHLLTAVSCAQRQQNANATGDGCTATHGGVAVAGIATAVGWGRRLGE